MSPKNVSLTSANIKIPGSRVYLKTSHLRSTHYEVAASLTKPQRMSKADLGLVITQPHGPTGK